uniref:Uncharacterized protein n=1 Tax=Rhipicephalus zambeziensis TaxID=60191 RepID=A0A224YF39_9ACAR
MYSRSFRRYAPLNAAYRLGGRRSRIQVKKRGGCTLFPCSSLTLRSLQKGTQQHDSIAKARLLVKSVRRKPRKRDCSESELPAAIIAYSYQLRASPWVIKTWRKNMFSVSFDRWR